MEPVFQVPPCSTSGNTPSISCRILTMPTPQRVAPGSVPQGGVRVGARSIKSCTIHDLDSWLLFVIGCFVRPWFWPYFMWARFSDRRLKHGKAGSISFGLIHGMSAWIGGLGHCQWQQGSFCLKMSTNWRSFCVFKLITTLLWLLSWPLLSQLDYKLTFGSFPIYFTRRNGSKELLISVVFFLWQINNRSPWAVCGVGMPRFYTSKRVWGAAIFFGPLSHQTQKHAIKVLKPKTKVSRCFMVFWVKSVEIGQTPKTPMFS